MRKIKTQFREAVRGAPAALFRLKPKTWVYLGFYLSACAVLCVLMTAAVAAADGKAADLALSWIFPESWHFVLEKMGQLFLHSASQQLLVSLALGLSLLVVTITLFPLKEHLSHSFESENDLTEDEVDPLPLWAEAWEESKLLILYATLFMSVFWVGYSDEPWRRNLAFGLSNLVLALTFAIDFISPTLFRHGMRYTTVFKTMMCFPIATLSFGALFALPPVLAGVAMGHFAPENWVWILVALFAAEVFAIVWACVGGTWLAAKLWPEAKTIQRPFWGARLLYWLVLLGLFAANIRAFSALGKSVLTKAPIFKSQYELVAGSFELDGLGLWDVLSTEPTLGFSMDLRITNPTEVDLILEENRLELSHQGTLVATTTLEPLRVESGEVRTQRVGVDLNVDLSVIRKGGELLRREDWDAVLYVELDGGREFPIYIY